MTEQFDIELAAERHQFEHSQSGEQFIVVEVAGMQCAVSITSVNEVEHVPNITRIPASPAWIPGVVNLRGSILTLVDPAMLMQTGTWQPSRDARMLVVGREDPVAMAIDRLGGMRRLTETARAPSIASLPGRAADFVSGVYHSEGDWLSILDIDRLLDEADRLVALAEPLTKGEGT